MLEKGGREIFIPYGLSMQCGTGKGIKSKVGGELELSLQALFTYLCDICSFECAISPLIFNSMTVVTHHESINVAYSLKTQQSQLVV
jgi:hypothetical protein